MKNQELTSNSNFRSLNRKTNLTTKFRMYQNHSRRSMTLEPCAMRTHAPPKASVCELHAPLPDSHVYFTHRIHCFAGLRSITFLKADLPFDHLNLLKLLEQTICLYALISGFFFFTRNREKKGKEREAEFRVLCFFFV